MSGLRSHPLLRCAAPRDFAARQDHCDGRRLLQLESAAPDPVTGGRSTPIYQTTSYVFEDVDHAASLFNLHNFGLTAVRGDLLTVNLQGAYTAKLRL
jgi:O-acetylhomoserine/O-acetylserine sulfhydrylase-like pyridoxal-dependent enzyme